MTRVIEAAPKAPEAAGKSQESPAESAEQRRERLRAEMSRASMSVPRMKMSVPELPGYVCYWFNDDQGRIERALTGFYEFVERHEVETHDFSLAGDSTKTGNQDMGTRVSMVVGTNEANQPMRAYLMKISEERYRVAQELLQEQNDGISRALKRGTLGAGQMPGDADPSRTYLKTVEVSRRNARPLASAGSTNSSDI